MASLRQGQHRLPVSERSHSILGRSLHRVLSGERIREGGQVLGGAPAGGRNGECEVGCVEKQLLGEKTVAHSLMQVMRMHKEES